jgi:putative transposase
VVLNPVRARVVPDPRRWALSSYRATVGETAAPAWLTTDSIVTQFSHRVESAQARYRTFVAEGRSGPRPRDQLMGQIYLGSEEFVAQHQPNHVIGDVPHRQAQATRPSLRVQFHGKQSEAKAIHLAYCRYGYRLAAIAEHLGVHYATVSRRLKHVEQANV